MKETKDHPLIKRRILKKRVKINFQNNEFLKYFKERIDPILDGCNDLMNKIVSLSVTDKLKKEEERSVNDSDKEEVFDLNKVLGMVWDANTDLITYNAKYKNADQFIEAMSLKKVSKGDWTKRLILRLSATVYDPLGLISPFTIRARTILQALWGENLDWDTPVPDKLRAS